MKKIRYLVLGVMLLPSCEFAVTAPIPSGSINPSPSVSVTASVSENTTVTPSPEDSSNLNTNNTGSPSSASSLPTATPVFPSGSSTVTPCIEPTPRPIPSPGTGNPNIKPTYENKKIIDTDSERVSFFILFKDHYKIRYNFDKKEFYSLTCIDVSEINQFLDKYNVKQVVSFVHGAAEEYLEKSEIEKEKLTGVDVMNDASIYSILDVIPEYKKFVEEFREISFVRTVNVSVCCGTTAEVEK